MADSGSSVAFFVRDAPIAAYIPVCGYTRRICIDHTYTINENGIILVYIYGIHLQHWLKTSDFETAACKNSVEGAMCAQVAGSHQGCVIS